MPTLLFTNLSFYFCMNLFSKKLSTKIASDLIICMQDEKYSQLDAVQLQGFELILNFSFWKNVFAVLPALTQLLLISPSSPCSLLDFLGRLHAWDLQLFFIIIIYYIYMVTVVEKMNGEESSCMFLCLEPCSRLQILGDFYCYLF